MIGNMKQDGGRPVEAMLFDLDGTLIDSTEAYLKIMEITFHRIGVPPVSREKILNAVVDGVFKWDDVLPGVDASQKASLIARARENINGLYPRIFREQVSVFPGVGELLRDLKAGGMKIGIATSTPMKQMGIKLHSLCELGIHGLLDALVTADDARKRKPAADPLLVCLNRMDTEPRKSVYIGDTRADIRAGKAAGMDTVGVLTGIDPYELLIEERPDLVLKSVVELRHTDYFPQGARRIHSE